MDLPFLHEVKSIKLVDVRSQEVVDAALNKLFAHVRETLYMPRGACLIFVVDEGRTPEELGPLRQVQDFLTERAHVHSIVLCRGDDGDLAVLEPSRAQLAEDLRRCGVEDPVTTADALLDRYYCVPRAQVEG